MGLPHHQDSAEFGIRNSVSRQQHFLRPLHSLENFGLWRLWHDRLQPIQAPIAAVDVGRILCREMKAPFWQPSGPLLCDPRVLRHLGRVLRKQQPMLHQLSERGTHTPL